MYKRVFRVPIVVGTIIFPFVVLGFIKFENMHFTWLQTLLIWPAVVFVVLILRLITLLNEHGEKIGRQWGHKVGRDAARKLFGGKE